MKKQVRQRKHLQTTYVTNDLLLECMMNSFSFFSSGKARDWKDLDKNQVNK